MESLLRDLVDASSHTLDARGCDAAADVLAAAVSLRCRRVPAERHGAHLFFDGDRPATDGGVLLVGHHDTVFSRDEFAGYTADGGVARGPGVLDMKGGLVVIAFALRALATSGLVAGRAITFASVSDEEVGSPESAPHLAAAAAGARAALVFEAGRDGDAIITARKGTVAITARATGRAAHAGLAHHLGASAIRAMARFVEGAEALTDAPRGVTVNVGTIRGGTSKNTVPAQCEAGLDARFVDPADGPTLVARLRAVAESSALPGTALALDGGVARAPLARTDASVALLRRYAAAQREAGLGEAEAPLQGGGSDASTTAAAGVPSIDGLGPRGSGFHTRDERVELASLRPKCAALVRFLAGFEPL